MVAISVSTNNNRIQKEESPQDSRVSLPTASVERGNRSNSQIMDALGQDRSYAEAASDISKAFSGINLPKTRTESRTQFSLGEIVSGGGRAVYAIDDENKFLVQVNHAFETRDGKKFTGKLEDRIKAFQGEMIEQDPKWKALEEELNKKGKTLKDGLIGPLTLKGLVDQGILKIDQDGSLQANQEKALSFLKDKAPTEREDQKLAYKVDKEPKKEPETKVADKVPEKEPEKKVADKVPEKEPEKKVADKDPTESERKKRENSEQIAQTISKLDQTTHQLSSLVVGTKTQIADTVPDLTRKTSEIVQICTTVRNQSNITSAVPVDMQMLATQRTTERELSACQDRLKRVEVEQIRLKSQVDQIKAEAAKNAGSLDPKKVADLPFIQEQVKYLREVHAEIQQQVKKCVADHQQTYASTKQEFTNFAKKELDTRTQLARLDPETVREHAKKHMPTYEENNPGQKWFKAYESFGLTFSKREQDSLNIYRMIRDTDENNPSVRNGCGFGMKYANNSRTYLENLRSLSTRTDNSLNPNERGEIAQYVKAMDQAKSLGIDNPLRFQPETLTQIVNERLNPDTSKPLMVITAAKSDWNGAFMQLNLVADRFLKQGFRVQYHEIKTESEFIDSLATATQNGRYLAQSLCVSGHGNKTQISLSDYDPGQNIIANSERTIDLSDATNLQPAGQYLARDSQIILNSCSTGKDRREQEIEINNMANFFRKVFPHVKRDGIFSPVAPANIDDIEFDADRISKIRHTHSVETYQASVGDHSEYDNLI